MSASDAQSGYFTIVGGIITLPSAETINLLSGHLAIRQEPNLGSKSWTARARIAPNGAIGTLLGLSEAVHVYLVGEALTWSGKAIVGFKPADADVELTGTGVLSRTPKQD